MQKKSVSPLWFPVLGFLLTILAGACLLKQTHAPQQAVSWIDALFTATSAVCVTGLAVVDTGTAFSRSGHWVLLALIQLGGLGIMTYSSLLLYLLRRRVSLRDRLAVGQALLHDPSFALGSFLLRMIAMVCIIETCGALLLWHSMEISLFSALFHAVSAFCNAGFSLYADSVSRWYATWGPISVLSVLIILGGLGFAVIDDTARIALIRIQNFIPKYFRPQHTLPPSGHNSSARLCHTSRVVLTTTAALLILGTLGIWLAETLGGNTYNGGGLTAAFFQSVTCRTAGFNSVPIGAMTNVTLLIMLFLMSIGGASGSCAGGMKVTTFRVLCAFLWAQARGRDQVIVQGRAMDKDTISKTLTLFTVTVLAVSGTTLLLTMLEGGDVPHSQARGQLLEILFEAVSAFSTTGLSTGITGTLSDAGKLLITLLMFAGRIGPIWLLSALQDMQTQRRYRWPETNVPIG